MEPIRVIGRMDQPEQILGALLAAGADARLVTTAPSAAAAETGRDGTGIDVLANGFDVCAAIKKRMSGRPVTACGNGVRFLLASGRPIGEPVAWYGPIVMNTQEELRIAFEEYRHGTFIEHKR